MASNVRSASRFAVQRMAIGGASGQAVVDPVEDRDRGRWSGPRGRRGPPPLTSICSWRTVNGDDVPSVQVGARVGRVDLLDDEVLDVRVDVRRAPRDPGVVTEDDAGHAGERDAGDVVRAGGRPVRQCSPLMYQTDGIEMPEVRVVGEERAAGGRHRRADDPVVRADAVVRPGRPPRPSRPFEGGPDRGRRPRAMRRPHRGRGGRALRGCGGPCRRGPPSSPSSWSSSRPLNPRPPVASRADCRRRPTRQTVG